MIERASSVLFTVSVGLLVCGCASGAFFTSPRTLDRGENEMSFSAELTASTVRRINGSNIGSGTGVAVTPVPYLNIRHGLAGAEDLGFHVGLNGLMSGDVKFGLVRSHTFDLAIDPGIGIVVPVWPFIHVPLVAGINPSEDFHVYFGPRVSYGAPIGSTWGTVPTNYSPHPPNGIIPGGLLAMRFGRAHGFWVQPEYNIMVEPFPLPGATSSVIHQFVAFTFGLPTGREERENEDE